MLAYHAKYNQARNQLGTSRRAKSFLRGFKFFTLCPMDLNYVQNIFPGGSKNFLGRAFAPLVPGLIVKVLCSTKRG